ncbi:alpha-ketoglutarate-dependent dioxygenase AlkB [Hymenobacter sediminis]|uniref:alpha-ketoglutarate-dependent dioxygenase AlkB family protein n=1 Tax=Hymenobacter sediminis TaxID=2218621 RepID=UPI000DA67CBB|nr:alpha-ketoglutarate-dependent dioxygenase AlkB [Hymenobacter sediminis]RPD46165.1 alpha-ketoglutarate-dependent dioxygenase AlkB [Hymenobacter sediminis]
MALSPIVLPNAELLLDPDFLPPAKAQTLFAELTSSIVWKHEPIKLFGREVMQPRLTAWHGDAGASYRYSGLQLQPQPWTPALLQLRGQVEAAAGAAFNSVLLNLYRSGQDSMGWHADDEPELGPEPIIASVTLGATRNFRLKPRDPNLTAHAPVTLPLTAGGLLLMRGPTQRYWLHALPKTTRPVGPRLNLTFRLVK